MCHPHLLLAAVSVHAASMVISGSDEGGKVTEVSGGGVVGHTADFATFIASRGDKGVPQIYEAGSAINI